MRFLLTASCFRILCISLKGVATNWNPTRDLNFFFLQCSLYCMSKTMTWDPRDFSLYPIFCSPWQLLGKVVQGCTIDVRGPERVSMSRISSFVSSSWIFSTSRFQELPLTGVHLMSGNVWWNNFLKFEWYWCIILVPNIIFKCFQALF